jgi:hypothetical protein
MEMTTTQTEFNWETAEQMSERLNIYDNGFSRWLENAQCRAWMRDWETSNLPAVGMTDAEIVALWNAERAAQKNITEIELTATTLLLQSLEKQDILNPYVREWVEGLCSAATYTVYAPAGTHTNTASYDHTQWSMDFKAEVERQWGSDSSMNDKTRTNYRYSFEIMNDAAINLGIELAAYRRDARKGGEHTDRIDNMSQISITTSLAAKIGEFVHSLRRSLFYRYIDQTFN